MESSKIMMFPEVGNNSNIDPALLMALNNNGGFGGGNWVWILFLWLIAGGGWGNNGFGNNNGTGYIANQISNSEGRDLLLQAINGRADALGQLAQITNTGVETVKNGIFTLQSAINAVGAQVGMSGLQVQNAIQSGDAALSRQLCECCCENRLLTTEQGYQAQIRTLEQTNQLGSQADRNFNTLSNEISGLKSEMINQFCELERRELQNKITTQGDIITQLRGQLDNDRQTAQLYAAINPIQAKVNEIASKQPNTVPVEWPNLTAVSTTPYMAGGFYGNGFGPFSYGYNNNVIF